MASLAANVAAAEPTLIGRVVAGWRPVCLIVSYELLMQQLPTRHTAAVPPGKPFVPAVPPGKPFVPVEAPGTGSVPVAATATTVPVEAAAA